MSFDTLLTGVIAPQPKGKDDPLNMHQMKPRKGIMKSVENV